jgi:ubiquinone biosynthesis protein UbiJ
MTFTAFQESRKKAEKDLAWHKEIYAQYFKEKWDALPLDEKIKRHEQELNQIKKRMKFLEHQINIMKGI